MGWIIFATPLPVGMSYPRYHLVCLHVYIKLIVVAIYLCGLQPAKPWTEIPETWHACTTLGGAGLLTFWALMLELWSIMFHCELNPTRAYVWGNHDNIVLGIHLFKAKS